MNGLVVQKYGGSVLTDSDAYTRAARHVARTLDRGGRVVAVVSALSGVTDELIRRAHHVNPRPRPEALDLLLATGELQSASLLALALDQRGIRAEALNPWQLGLHTDSSHGGARITRINPLPLKAKLSEYPVVTVPGFLGRGEDNRLTTLGRGGSDLSAVALADTLDADACEFFKDVPGYFSADPHLVPEAVHRPVVSSEEAFELSRFGCRFLQDRAISWAVKSRCRVLLRALDEDERATVLSDDGQREEQEEYRILALTHCDTPENFSGQVPGEFGARTALLSVVGRGLECDLALPSLMVEHLDRHGIPSISIDRARSRLTLAVGSDDLPRAQQLLHEKLITTRLRSSELRRIHEIQ